ncbi:gamma-butyrobetaine hydroxylase-like domain-containing protein [Luteolibacter marinus]|uniref:gamma-butyrobetaine hydroxylase-like domain-containing protein n=1 Tax=Luteolibacter marinus TaxID=2776705 RepID=UPI001868FA45|nr:DUF971 domain-containing protein [Luteolibacter marinus]
MKDALGHAAVIGNELALAFDDGDDVFLALDLLRRGCPCAACQGEPDALGRVLRPVQKIGPRGFELLRFEVVGGYALQLWWADGHSTGIYSFDYLRTLSQLA